MNFGNSMSSSTEGVTADMYSVTVRRELVEGEMFFVGRVREFPDVEIFEESHELAYSATVAALTDLIAQLREEGMAVPQPLVVNDRYSGRVTLRMPKSMHCRVDRCAQDEGVSINAFLVCAVENYLAQSSSRATWAEVAAGATSGPMRIGAGHIIANTSHPSAKVFPRGTICAGVKTSSSSWSAPAVLRELHWVTEGEAWAEDTRVLKADAFSLAGDDADPIHRHYFPGTR